MAKDPQKAARKDAKYPGRVLYVRHLDRISLLICNPNSDLASLDAEVIHHETLLWPWIDDYEAYQADMLAVQELYSNEKRQERSQAIGKQVNPDAWHLERRLMELRTGFKWATKSGLLADEKLMFLEPDAMLAPVG